MFSIKESIRYGWNKSKENLELVFFTTLLMLAVSGISGGTGESSHLSPLLAILATIFLIIVRIGYTKIFLRMHDGESPRFSDIFKEYRTFWRYLGVSILFPLTILGGLILIIIPGIIWAVRFSFAPLIVIDVKSGPIKAMRESWAITRGSFWKILWFWLLAVIFNFVGLMFFGIGLLLTIPITTFAAIWAYRKLSAARAGISTEPLPSPQPAQ